jgi:hypothetical protein
LGALGFVPWKNEIWLPSSFSAQTVVHELGHVLDNDSKLGGLWPATYKGGGAADRMIRFMGGQPDNCHLRWFCKNGYVENVAGRDPCPSGSYGSNSVADDFAESFVYAVFNMDGPQERLAWMAAFISVTGTK